MSAFETVVALAMGVVIFAGAPVYVALVIVALAHLFGFADEGDRR